MTTIQKKILIVGIRVKIARNKVLEDILSSYITLSNEDKQELRNYFERS